MASSLGRKLAAALAVFGIASATTTAVVAQENFYEGKQLSMLVGVTAGGTPDVYARALARHMGKYIPGNPTFVVQNLPGAQGINVMNALAKDTARDGTAIGIVINVLLLQKLIDEQFPFDAREFNWLGSLNRETNLVVVSDKAPAKTFDDVFKDELIVAATNEASDNFIFPRIMNDLLGTKFRAITGYSGDPDMTLAMERGEVHGRAAVSWSGIKVSMADKLKDGSARVLLQLALEPNPELAGVPMLLDYVKDPAQRQIFEFLFARQLMGRPFFTAPGVPVERVELLRKAMAQTVADPEFVEEVKRINLDVSLLEGAEMQSRLDDLYRTPPEVLAEVKRLIGN